MNRSQPPSTCLSCPITHWTRRGLPSLRPDNRATTHLPGVSVAMGAVLACLACGNANQGPITPTPTNSTYILSGGHVEAGVDFPLKDVRIEVIGGPMSGRVTMTDEYGYYTLDGVVGARQVQASKDGWVTATQNVSPSTTVVNFLLISSGPDAAIGGVYRLTFTAAASCALPDFARRRSYTATIRPLGARATVTLTDAQFYISDYCGPMNTFDALVHGNTVSLADWGGDCGIIEIGNGRYVKLWGTAEAIIGTDSIQGPFNGSVSIGVGPDDPIATCTAPDHQLVFERTGSTAVGPYGSRFGRERAK